ncbi:hypothetical protein [Chitinophaga rhizophila]|uniref:YD repeat-containing protein n=1 Tax=Chitinophaga rhizophila TaxID=2866212 RepID=A0ABS7GK06_9BACT|nr:hypothetical protein [Chitinophaga rhizophila]MBW8686987.1 hypothetical protein [Chitinophaga rhizophila]
MQTYLTWYDRLGRMAVSQNAKQRGTASFSYTTYDSLGRTNEVGEVSSAAGISDNISRTPDRLKNSLNNIASSKREITRTNYDVAAPFMLPGQLAGRNLRGHVSWTALYNTAASLNNGPHSAATFYTYDVHGNVDTLVQEYVLGRAGDGDHVFKKTAYNYDLSAER